MTGVLSALAPVFGLIAVGYLLKSRRIFTDDFWDPAERLTFYFLFPALLITSIGGAEAVGPILMGLDKPVHLMPPNSTVEQIAQLAAIAVVDAQIRESVA